MKYRLCILANENPLEHENWIKAIEKSRLIEYCDIVNLVSDRWFELLNLKEYDLFLLKPPGKSELFKKLYDERVILLDKYFTTPIYPSLAEVLIYENKRFLRDWLLIHNIDHPETHVFFDKREAISYLKTRNEFPLMGKTNIGASGNGVVKLNNCDDAKKYIYQAFNEGITPRFGPKLTKGSFINKLRKGIKTKGFLRQRLKDYRKTMLDVQFNFVILQEFIPHNFEWRCVRIGDSFFAHKKIIKGGMASGGLIKGYDYVPMKLLDYFKNITDKHHLTSVAVDLFEKNEGYLINEIQCFFGQSDPYQMLVENKPGCYMFNNGTWNFEEGMFNTNESYDLRLAHALSLITKKGQI